MTAIKALAALSAFSLLAACTSATTGELDRSRTGMLTGAIAGGLFGAANGGADALPETIIGAGLGAIAGQAIGSYLDQQAAELRRDLGPQVGVQNTGSEIILSMPQDILFATDSAMLRPDLQSDLLVIARNLQRYPESSVVVVGHTDNTGAAAYNQRLSERRADSVASVLITAGVPVRRIVSRGAGENQPIASNETATGRAQNRRVEITIRPNG
tara:strand:- start:962 stop:1603 length:642 start_codon:yes stop_codon:yes gene_type:complete